MNGLSENDSSDSSDQLTIDSEKNNLQSKFFSKTKVKPNVITSDSDTANESSDEEDFGDVNETNSIELFTQVLKNLEYSQKLEINNDNNEKQQSMDCPVLLKKEEKLQKLNTETQDNISFNEINELLLQGECSTSSPQKLYSTNAIKNEDPETPNEYTIPKEGVKITLPGTSLVFRKKKKKGEQDLKAILRKRIRASEILIEKVGLLCWLAYGFFLNRQINQPEIMSSVLSLIPTDNYPKKRIDLVYLEKFTKWFKHIFSFDTIETNGNKCISKETLLKIIEEKKISDYKELVLLYIVALRALGLNCRLVISLSPPHKAFSDSPLFKPDSKSKSNAAKEGNTSKKVKKEKKEKVDSTNIIKNSSEAKKNANMEAKKKAAEILRSTPQKNTKKNKSVALKDSKTDSKTASTSNNESSDTKDESKIMDQEKSTINFRQLRSRKVNAASIDNRAVPETDGTKSKYYMKEESTDSETEFQPKPKRLASKKNSDKKEVPKASKSNNKRNTKLLSSDSETDETNKTKKTQDIWAEVYLESEESWICASVMDEKIHCVTDIYKKAKKPVLYIVAWNYENLIKDVTRRYCPHWLTVTRKQRVDEKWWHETLSYWKEKNTAISKAEDEMLLQKELEQPLPKTIGECKGHPLYVIARHLLKFEALYPPDCVPLGHTNTGDAIYSRHCVHTLRSRETWLKQARVVKPKQDPYKIVKARPKYDKLSGTVIKDSALEVFGEWQTMPYEPPEAKDGVVPRNEYGNVDLFQHSMLPKGTVHINLPGLNRIAKKLNIDCAPAVVGFNFGCMGAVPAIEGYVVCSEFEDTLREAWEAEQVEAAKRAREKQEKRVYGNWKKLIHGLRIRERLAIKYEFSKEDKSVASNKRSKSKKTDAKKPKLS